MLHGGGAALRLTHGFADNFRIDSGYGHTWFLEVLNWCLLLPRRCENAVHGLRQASMFDYKIAYVNKNIDYLFLIDYL
jgi:hypothetical protein